MQPETLIFLLLGGLAGGFINGFSGTGTALFAMGFFLMVLEPQQAVAITTVIAVLSGLQGLWVVRKTIPTIQARVLRILLPGLAGVPLGLMLLTRVDAAQLRLLVAALLIIYGLYFGFRANLPRFDRRTPLTDASIGFLGGLMGGLAGLAGALLTIWVSMRPWPKEETRALLQGFNIVILTTIVLALALRGAYDRPTLTALAIAFPAGICAAQLGIYTFKRLTDDQFRRILILLCLALGLGIIIQILTTA